MKKRPTLLIILDGFGYSPEKHNNAIALAKTPNFDFWLAHYPHTLLQASGPAVGMPPGFIGNSEVGHLTIGCGRIVPQPALVINSAIADGSFFRNPVLLDNLGVLKKRNGTLHIMGLLSDAGVHSLDTHAYAFLDAAKQQGIEKIIVHPFLDGRDVPPQSAGIYLERLDKKLATISGAKIGTLHGRYYAMDRDDNWSRTQQCYDVLVNAADPNPRFENWHQVLDYYYAQNMSDEFIKPTPLDNYSGMVNGDMIIFFNYRSERARQLTTPFVDRNFHEFATKSCSLTAFLTPYPFANYLHNQVLFHYPVIHNTLKFCLAKAHKRIFSIAETEKYAHVTYFFDGMHERKLPEDTTILIPSIKTATYINYPCMSAPEITHNIINSLNNDPCDFYVINYANADMVGHSGNLPATIKAVECLDSQLKEVFDVAVQKLDGTIYITADHGKAEEMIYPKTGEPRKGHTANPVPFIMLNNELKDKKFSLPLKGLSDIAPFILEHMNLPIPPEMKHPKKE